MTGITPASDGLFGKKCCEETYAQAYQEGRERGYFIAANPDRPVPLGSDHALKECCEETYDDAHDAGYDEGVEAYRVGG